MNGLGMLLAGIVTIAWAFPNALGGWMWKVRKGYMAAKDKNP